MSTKDIFNTFIMEIQEESLRKLVQNDEDYINIEKSWWSYRKKWLVISSRWIQNYRRFFKLTMK